MNFKSLVCVIGLLIFSFVDATAQAMTGEMLAKQIFDRDRGKNSVSSAQMVLVSKKGHKRTRQFTTIRLLEGDLERQIIRFTLPADIDGTGFLTIEKPGWETEQFLYLPGLKRTRRIVSSQKSSRFVNSDFTYEDMERHPVDDYTYKITESKRVNNLDCYVLESRPKEGTKSQYSLIVSLVEKQSSVAVSAQYFDRKGTHIKTYTVLKLDRVQEFWTESTVSMEDLKKGHKTYIKLDNIRYNSDIDKTMIDRKSLENY
jgi:hypothetical protein